MRTGRCTASSCPTCPWWAWPSSSSPSASTGSSPWPCSERSSRRPSRAWPPPSQRSSGIHCIVGSVFVLTPTVPLLSWVQSQRHCEALFHMNLRSSLFFGSTRCGKKCMKIIVNLSSAAWIVKDLAYYGSKPLIIIVISYRLLSYYPYYNYHWQAQGYLDN